MALKRGERSKVEDGQQSRRVVTCTTSKAVSDEDFDGADEGESTRLFFPVFTGYSLVNYLVRRKNFGGGGGR